MNPQSSLKTRQTRSPLTAAEHASRFHALGARTARWANERRTLIAVFFAFATTHCGGADPTDTSSASNAFAGRFQATWSSVATITSPPGVSPQDYTDTAVIDVTAFGDRDVEMKWQVGANAPSGTITFEVNGDSAIATGIGTGGTCWMGRLTNGALQTTCATSADAEIQGDELVQHQTGTISGVTPDNVAYTGTYEGTWRGTRVR